MVVQDGRFADEARGEEHADKRVTKQVCAVTRFEFLPNIHALAGFSCRSLVLSKSTMLRPSTFNESSEPLRCSAHPACRDGLST